MVREACSRLADFAVIFNHFRVPHRCQRVSPGNEIRRTLSGLAPVWHFYSEIELNLVIAGNGSYFLDNAHYDLSPGSLVWMLPNQSHRLLPGPDLQMWVLTRTNDRLERAWLDDVSRYSHRVLAREDAIALDRLFVHVSQDADDPQTYCAGLDYALRSALHVSASGPEAAQPPFHPAVLTALRVLRDTPDVPNLAALAQCCGVSPAYLRELLAEQTGRGFVDWRNCFRLERFQLLYPDSGDLLTAALEAGFGSYNQFHRVFSEVVGTTPGDWVKGGLHSSGGPPLADFARVPDNASSRMVWYLLTGSVFDEARRWIEPSFANLLVTLSKVEEPARLISSHVAASYDQHSFELDLLRKLEARDAESARRLQAVFSRFDVFAAAENALSLWGYNPTNIAAILGCHIVTASIYMHGHRLPSHATVRAFVARVAPALEKSGSFEKATILDRQRAATALCLQHFLLRSAYLAAFCSGRSKPLDIVHTAAKKAMMEVYGLNLRSNLIKS